MKINKKYWIKEIIVEIVKIIETFHIRLLLEIVILVLLITHFQDILGFLLQPLIGEVTIDPLVIDFYNFREQGENQIIEVLSIIVGTLGSILGIVITILLLAFEILRRSFKRYVFFELFKEERFKIIVTLFTITIVLSVYCLSSFTKPLQSTEINLITLCLTLFIVSLIFLFPYSSFIITSIRGKALIFRVIDKITPETIRTAINLSHIRIYATSETVMEYNPLFELMDIGKEAIIEGNCENAKLIVLRLQDKLLHLLNNKKFVHRVTRRELINVFLSPIKTITYEALKNENQTVLLTILFFIEDLSRVCTKLKLKWSDLIEFNDFIWNLLSKAQEQKMEGVLELGYQVIEGVAKGKIQANLTSKRKNLKNEESFLGAFEDWRFNIASIMGSISRVAKKSISSGNLIELQRSIHTLTIIQNYTINTKVSAENEVKVYLVSFQNENLVSLATAIIEEGLYGTRSSSIFLNPFYLLNIEGALKQDQDFSRIPLVGFSSILFVLVNKGKLDSSSLNKFVAIGRQLASQTRRKKIYKESVMYIIKVLNKLRIRLEQNKELTERFKYIYLELYKQTRSLKEFLTNSKPKDVNLIKLIKGNLSKFRYRKKIESEIRKEFIYWPVLQRIAKTK